MSHRLIWAAVVGTVCGLGVLVWTFSEAQSPPLKVQSENDIVFANVADNTLKLDLSMPVEGSGPFPAVVCIHGGGWVGGERKQMTKTIEVLARRGYVAAAPDYRVAPKDRFPACIEDCMAAVRWLRANSGKYHIDPTRIGAVGLAAGGHLACLLAVTETADAQQGNTGSSSHESRVQAVVSFAGPTDLTDETLQVPQVLKENLIPLLGGTPREQPDAYRKASPFQCPLSRTPPPFLLVHGSDDKVVPVRQVQAFAEKLQRSGGKAHVRVLEGEGHTWSGASLVTSIDEMLSFLDENLKK